MPHLPPRWRLLLAPLVVVSLAACATAVQADRVDTGETATGGAWATDAATSPAERRSARPAPRSTARATPRPAPTATPDSTPDPTPDPTPQPTPVFGAEPSGPTALATVVSITDGDTIRVMLDGVEYPVRYIGIDTPEVHSGVEPMGREATEANAALVAGRQVVLETDVSETDRYGRLLRYVWVENDSGWVLVNLELLRLGMAQVTTYPPDVKYVDALYLPAQSAAIAAGIGVWGLPPPPPPPPAPPASVAPPPPPPPPVATAAPVGNCELSYPGICITVGSADLDCGEITWRRFFVDWNVPMPDPHGFDGDADGIGCES